MQSPDPADALSNCTTGPDSNAAAEAQMVVLINQARAAAGVGQLKVSPNLQRAALWKSADSSAYGPTFSHTDSLGRDTVSETSNRAIDCGYSTSAAENIAWGFDTAQSAFDAWMASPGHHANIVDPNSVVIGVGEVVQNGVPCWTADFGEIDDSGQATLPAVPAPPATPNSSMQLAAGINLVAFPGPTESITQATRHLDGILLVIYRWDAVTQTWQAYFPGAPDYAQDLDSLTTGTAYYIIMRTAATWSY